MRLKPCGFFKQKADSDSDIDDRLQVVFVKLMEKGDSSGTCTETAAFQGRLE